MGNIMEIFNKNTGVWDSYPVLKGKSAYQSYLDTTTDIPPLSEDAWGSIMLKNDGYQGIIEYHEGDIIPEGSKVRFTDTLEPFVIYSEDIEKNAITRNKLSSDIIAKLGFTLYADTILKSILKIKMRQSGLNLDVDAWSDTLEDINGINTSLSSNYIFSEATKSLKVPYYDANHIGVWYFNESSGATCSPTIGSISGTCTGTTIVTDDNITARSFNGISDKIIFGGTIIPVGAKTIRFKMKQNGNPANDKAILCGSTSYSSGANGDVVRLTTAGQIWYLLGQNMTFIVNVVHPTNVCDNVWHDVMITWDGTTNEGGVKIYVDNISNVASGKATSTQYTTPTNNLQIGYDYYHSTAYFGGMIDTLEISNIVRTTMPSYDNINNTATIVWKAVQASDIMNSAIIESVSVGTINYYISRDGGTTFTECSRNVVCNISSQPEGVDIVLKAILTNNAELLAISWGCK